jgi:hypothetical protein
MPKNKPTPEETKMRKHLDQVGTDPRSWTPDQRATYAELSDDATRSRVPRTK